MVSEIVAAVGARFNPTYKESLVEIAASDQAAYGVSYLVCRGNL